MSSNVKMISDVVTMQKITATLMSLKKTMVTSLFLAYKAFSLPNNIFLTCAYMTVVQERFCYRFLCTHCSVCYAIAVSEAGDPGTPAELDPDSDDALSSAGRNPF
jgi:hypothetical protein